MGAKIEYALKAQFVPINKNTLAGDEVRLVRPQAVGDQHDFDRLEF